MLINSSFARSFFTDLAKIEPINTTRTAITKREYRIAAK
jgi:hypothetical protein